MSENDEDHYEAIELIVKSRSKVDGETWFDVIHDFITADCDSVELEDGEWSQCSCGLVSMGASGGTLDQCYAWSTNLGGGLQPIDLARAIVAMLEDDRTPDVLKVIEWARKEIEFEDYFETKGWEQDDD